MSPQGLPLTHDCPCRAFVKLMSPEWLRQCLERQDMLSPDSFEIPVTSLVPVAPQAGQQLQPSASGFAGGQSLLVHWPPLYVGGSIMVMQPAT